MTNPPVIGLCFPFRFEAARLRADLARVHPRDWTPHYNERDFGGQWSGVALRSASGMERDLIASPPAENAAFQDTPLLGSCANFRDALARFECPLKSVRLLSLASGSFIREHSDHALGFEDGEIRIHIPIETNPGVEFYVCGERLLLEEGGCYYVNVNLPHRVNNRGASARIHLVIDAEVNDWVRDIFREKGQPLQRSPLPPGGLDDFRELVLGDEALQERLRLISDRETFIARTVALGRERGFDFHESDIDAGFRSRPTPLDHAPGPEWTPVRFNPAELTVESIWTGKRRFSEPFFEDTIRAARRNPFAALFRCVSPLFTQTPPRPPDGLIFHMSRCGSTLIAQMLTSLPDTRVISEAPPIDEALGCSAEALRAVTGMLARDRCFIKLDAWHIHSLPLFRDAFPDTPWIFVSRDLREVIESHVRVPGSRMIPNRPAELTKVLSGITRKAQEFRDDPNGMFIDYSELPEAAITRIAPHFNLTLSAEDKSRMQEAAQRDAKNPTAMWGGLKAGKGFGQGS